MSAIDAVDGRFVALHEFGRYRSEADVHDRVASPASTVDDPKPT